MLYVAFADVTIFATSSFLAGCCQLPLLGLSKDRPSVVLLLKSPLLQNALLPSASGRSEPSLPPCSVSVVLRHPDGFRLFNPARVLQRAADHGVRDVLSSLRSCRPITRSRPSKSSPLSKRLSKHFHARIAGLTSPACCQDVHRRPSLPVLSEVVRLTHCCGARLLPWTSRVFSRKGFVAIASVARRNRPILPWACCSLS